MKFKIDKSKSVKNIGKSNSEDIDLIVENKNLKDELKRIDNYYAIEIEKIKADYEKHIDNLINEIETLRARALVNPRKVTDEQVIKIKELRASGLSYRAIVKETGLSTCTIQRALNGVYDI